MQDEPKTERASEAEVKARTAGRGGIAVLAAKGFFIVTGFLQQILLTRAIGLAEYGSLARSLALANIVNNVVVSGSTQGVSRTVAGAGERWREALRSTLRVHVPLAVLLAFAFASLSPVFAAFEKAPQIQPVLLALSGVVLLYGLYAPLVGSLNGRNRFTQQATLDILFAALRTVAFVGLGYLFARRGLSGALGAACGFVLAALAIYPLALRWAGTGATEGAPRVVAPRAYLAFLLPVAGAQLFTNMLMQIDISLLGRFLSFAAPSGADGAKSADEWVGVYRACQLFAFLPYQLLFSVTQVLFPMLARANAEGDREAVRTYALRGARIATIAAGLLVSLVVALAGPLLSLAYGTDVAARGEVPLRILAAGQGAFAILGVALTILTSLGRERTSAILTLAATVLVGGVSWAVVPFVTFGSAQLLATAICTALALVLVLALAAWTVRREAGGFVELRTGTRVLLAFVLTVAVGIAIPHGAVHGAVRLLAYVVAVGAGLSALYLALLVGTRELGTADVSNVRAVVMRRSGR